MIKTNDIYWMAGLLEGEGSFTVQRNKTGNVQAIISLGMSDLDVIERARSVFGACSNPCPNLKAGRSKIIYTFKVSSRRAAGWMMMLYPLMSVRRQARIREVLALWMQTPSLANWTANLCSAPRGAGVI